MQLLFHPDEDDSDDYNLKCGVEDIQWSVEVVLTTGMSSKCSRDIAQCSATQWPILHVPLWYSMGGCALVWYGIRWYIMGGSTWWYILIAFVSSGMVEYGLVKTMVWVSVLSGNTTNSYQLKAGCWMTVTIKSRFLGGVLVWHCSQGISGIDQRILIWWHQMKIWDFIANNWTTLTSCWLSKDLTKAREMRRWGSKD